MRCHIGISCDWESFVDARGSQQARYMLNESYVQQLNAAGAAAVLLPHQQQASAEHLLDGLGALILSGGDCDIPPATYGQLPAPGLRRTIAQRSHFELELAAAAWARGMPILGVCGGMQVLNVARGGSLFQDIRHRPHSHNHEQPAAKSEPSHWVDLVPDSQLCRWVGQPRLQVNSAHHQLVDHVGDRLRAVAHAPDGVIEAIEAVAMLDAASGSPTPQAKGTGQLPNDDQPRWVLGLQWHPEALRDDAHALIWRRLVAAATAYAGAVP